MAKVLYLVLLSVYFCQNVKASNILAIFPLASSSHYTMFDRLLKALVERGHDIDVVSHFPQKTPFKGLNDLSIKGSLPMFQNNLSISVVGNLNQNDLLDFMLTDCGYESCAATLKTDVLRDLRYTKKKYDLLITEVFTFDCMLGFGYIFNIPVISLTSSVNLPWGADRIGNPDNPSYIPTYFTTSLSKMTLTERIFNTFLLVQAKIKYRLSNIKPLNDLSREFFGADLPDLEELALNTSLLMVNSHFSTNFPRPNVPNFIEVAGLHIKEPKPLPKDLEDIINSSTNGVIYLTMGSMIMTESFPPNKLQDMFDAFSELPYTVLWKAVKEKFPKGLKFPNNIHFQKWLPQVDILCHPKTNLFISHGGLMSSQEAVYCGVPRIGIPIFADQFSNINDAVLRGLAVHVDFKNITKVSILGAVKEILNNLSYKENSKRLSALFKDRPQHPLETAVYWTEYVIRHRGAPHLRSAGADLYWYQYYLLDVLLILVSIALLLIFCFVHVTKLLLNLFQSKKKIKKQ